MQQRMADCLAFVSDERAHMKEEIRALADRYAAELKRSIDARVNEMETD